MTNKNKKIYDEFSLVHKETMPNGSKVNLFLLIGEDKAIYFLRNIAKVDEEELDFDVYDDHIDCAEVENPGEEIWSVELSIIFDKEDLIEDAFFTLNFETKVENVEVLDMDLDFEEDRELKEFLSDFINKPANQ